MVRFNRASPSIYVSDMQPALEFYSGRLGFEMVFTNGSPVSFAVLRRDAVQIHLALRPETAGSSHTHIVLNGLDSFYEGLTAMGVAVRQPPRAQPWGLRDIVLADPDGNTFEFAETMRG